MRKLAAMHAEYGKRPGHTCRECCNCVRGEYHGEAYVKCRLYGFTYGTATDWSGRYAACGRFNRSFDTENDNPLIEELTHGPDGADEIDGQINF